MVTSQSGIIFDQRHRKLFKGGVYCRHGWVRVIYASQLDREVSREQLAAEWDEVMKRVGANPYVPGVGIERVAPNQMPNRASLK